MNKRIVILFAALGLFALTCFSQNQQIDSLKKVIASADNNNDTTKVNVLLAISRKYVSTSPSEAIVYAVQARDLSETINYQKGLANAYKSIGIGYYWQGSYVDAIHNYQKALTVFQSLHDNIGIANIQSNIGAIYFDQSDDEKALEYYFKSLKASEDASDTLGIIRACVNIGAVYSNKPKTYDKALEYLRRALPLSLALKDNDCIGMTTVNLGEVYFKKNEDSLALSYFNRSLKASENSVNIPYSLNYIGKVYQKRKDYYSALKYHQQAYDFASKSDAKLDMAQSLLGIASSQRLSGLLPEAITSYKKAEEIAQELKANYELKEAYDGLAKAYAARSDFSNAFKYQNLLITIKDTLYNIDADKKLQGLQFNFDLEKKESRIALLTKNDEINQQIIRSQKLVRNGFIGGFIIVLLFASAFFTQRNRIRKEKRRSEELLLNILPSEVAEELKEKGTANARHFADVTVLFTDFKAFTTVSERLTPQQLVDELHACFSAFDEIIAKHHIEKIKTSGDAYLAVCGLPIADDRHAENIIKAAIDIREFMLNRRKELGEMTFEIRIGVHTGSVVAGIVGVNKFIYDIWGDTVNTAARMEQNSEAGRINISQTTYELVKDKFNCIHRGKIEAKNKGLIDMYFVNP